MKFAAIIRGLVVSVAVLGICLPQTSLASKPVKQASVVVDVALGQGGLLLGQFVDTNGAAKANTPVSLRLGNRELAMAKTDTNGYFAFSGLRGGVYQLVAAKGVATCRVWAERTAPPTAQKVAVVFSGQEVVRGQLMYYLANPWVVAAVVATAVSVPVGIYNASNNDPSSP